MLVFTCSSNLLPFCIPSRGKLWSKQLLAGAAYRFVTRIPGFARTVLALLSLGGRACVSSGARPVKKVRRAGGGEESHEGRIGVRGFPFDRSGERYRGPKRSFGTWNGMGPCSLIQSRFFSFHASSLASLSASSACAVSTNFSLLRDSGLLIVSPPVGC